jgi:hypothetical protein
LPEEIHARDQNTVYRDVYETAKRNFAPWPNAILVRGKIPDVLRAQPIEKVCYLMLDLNILVRPHLSSFGTKWCPVAWFYLTITVGLDTTHSERPMTHLLNQKAPRFSICRPGKAC